MMSISKHKVKYLSKKDPRAKILYKLIGKPEKLLGVILFGNNLFNIYASALATIIAINLWGEISGVIIAPIITTCVLLIFGEITPKTLAAWNNEKIALFGARFINSLINLCAPLISILNWFSKMLLSPLGIDGNNLKPMSTDELIAILQDHNIESTKKSMLLNILDLDKISADMIMVDTNKIQGIDLEDGIENITKAIQKMPFKRVPVYSGTLQNLHGTITSKSLLKMLSNNELTIEHIKANLKKPKFIAETQHLYQILLEEKTNKYRMVFVLSEYGEIIGLLTLEDLLEEIIGDFTTDQYAPNMTKLDEHNFLIDPRVNIRDVNRKTKLNLANKRYSTLNGYLLSILEEIPNGNCVIKQDNILYEILRIEDKVINLVKLTKL